MSKKNYKKTALERQQHDTAVKVKKMTNYEKLKQMSVNEITQFLFVHQFSECNDCGYYQKQCSGKYFDDKSCTMGIKRWLESEVEE